jgi:protein translocase SecG subunit
MASFLRIVEIGSAVLLVLTILLQHRGTGLGGAFGGQGLSYRSRRGVEQLLLRTTTVFAALFLITLVARLFI